jgi:tetratricopeptide (TPR) repeat protein
MVSKIIGFLDQMIAKFRGYTVLGPPSVLENWTAKVEVCAGNGRMVEAVETLHEVHVTLEVTGYAEEMLRLSELVLPGYGTIDSELVVDKLDVIANAFICGLSHMGRYADADGWLNRIAESVVGKTTRYIWLCGLRAYSLWVRQDYVAAIKWATEGDTLKVASHIDTQADCKHNLALARRDSGDVGPALEYFLRGEKLECVLSPQHFEKKRGGPYYGNIGRCLQLQGRLDEALVCLRKSAVILETEGAHNVLMNRGWAAQWLALILEQKGEVDAAYIAFRGAAASWSNGSPQRSRDAMLSAERLSDRVSDKTLLSSGEWECTEIYRRWLRQG